MKWEGRRKSKNFEDRRGGNTGKVVAGGGLIGIIAIVFHLLSGGDSQEIMQMVSDQMLQRQDGTQIELTEEDRRLGDFVATVLADTEDVWHQAFNERGMSFREPKLILFRDAVQSACGGASANSGPFYCPADESVYMDLSFFDILQSRFGAKGGDFAIAYVIAHEVGHHVQHQLGILKEVHQIRSRLSETDGNRVHVAMELQADFYAGMWAHHIDDYLSSQDIDQALSAAAAVGNDAIQKRTQGYVVAESFTHGSSAQRTEWFTRGYKSGKMEDGDTFAALLQ